MAKMTDCSLELNQSWTGGVLAAVPSAAVTGAHRMFSRRGGANLRMQKS